MTDGINESNKKTTNNQKENAMSKKELDRFYDQELPKFVFAVRFDLRDGDVSLSAKLLAAADKQDWNSVTALLEQGADPRICRISDGNTRESALFIALKAKQFKIAKALYNAGDRLDDLLTGENTIPADTLQFLVWQSAIGRNYFIEEEKPLSECVRCGLWNQVSEKIGNASKEELDLSAMMIGYHLRQWNAESYLQILRDLKKLGADLAKIREQLPALEERFRKWPKLLCPDEETFRQISEIVNKA